MADQSSKSHARFDPWLHFTLFPLTLGILIGSILQQSKQHTPANFLLMFVGLALVWITLRMRFYALANQDRIIRLEENVRLHALSVDASGLTMAQMIALRFAPDAEVVELAPRAARENLTPKQTKDAIVQWKADHRRV